VVSRDVLDIYPRKVCFQPASGKAMVKRLAATHAAELLASERAVAKREAADAKRAGSVDLF
jgi:chemotaxis protein CheD